MPNGCCKDDDNDGICNIKDVCPDVFGNLPNGCPDSSTDTAVIIPIVEKTKATLPNRINVLVPSLLDYKLNKFDAYSKGKPHWLWGGGVATSLGISGYYFLSCNAKYKGCKIPRDFENGNFNEYRDAKREQQNAIVFAGIGGVIWVVNILHTNKKYNRLKNLYGYQYQIEPFAEMEELFSSTNLNVGMKINFIKQN